MGLSDQERISKLFWACKHLAELGQKLPDEPYPHNYTELKALCSQVWHAFLGNTSNGAHWLFGSSAGNKIDQPNNPWAVALHAHFETDRSYDQPDWLETSRQERQREYDEAKDTALLDDPEIERLTKGFISIEAILRQVKDGNALAETFLIYAQTENVIYALRRYTDKLRASLPQLDKLVSDIQGQCFSFFTQDQTYAKAYLLHQILDALFAYQNPVRALGHKQCWFHHLPNAVRHDLKQLRQWHLVTQKPDVTPTDWVVLALQIMGKSYNYQHQLDELFKIAQKRDIPLDQAKVRAAFEACVKLKEKQDKADTEHYRTDSQYGHLEAIHGYEIARQLAPRFPKPKPKRTRKPKSKTKRKPKAKPTPKSPPT